MGWFSSKKDDPPAKEPIDWDNLTPGKLKDPAKAIRDIENASHADMIRLTKLRGGHAGAMHAMYSREELAELDLWREEEAAKEEAAKKKKGWLW